MSAETEMRAEIVKEALSWVRTPYVNGAKVKGAGVDCGQIIVAVFGSVGAIENFDTGYYNPQHHLHSNEEVYMKYVTDRSHEIPGPPLPGDVVLFKFGRVYSHGAIVINWPRVVHSQPISGTIIEDVEKCTLGGRALANLPRKYFSLWKS